MPRKDTDKSQKPMTEADRREQRLAEALRANLKRRKAGKAGGAAKPDPAGE